MLTEAVLTALEPCEHGIVLDATVGGGGHARRVLERFPGARLLGSDVDPEAMATARAELEPFGERVRLVQARADRVVREAGIAPGALCAAFMDLGVSSRQLDAEERGFTFRRGAPLDMRMDPSDADAPTAADLLNQASERELAHIFRDFAEEPRGRSLARLVCRRRTERSFRTSDDLVGALAAVLGRAPSPREKARLFQGLRMAVNDEPASLRGALESIRDALEPGGTFVVISYHSLEDREVKRTFREWSRACVCPPDLPVCACRGEPLGTVLTRRPVTPDAAEVTENPRARSARMRVWRAA